METERFNLILHNENYKKYVGKIEECEKNRRFCRHNLTHFLDVARIGYIINLEQNLGIKKDIIYGAALLHDIGRWKQYESGIPHDMASGELAQEILIHCGYEREEISMILEAILAHRTRVNNCCTNLQELLYMSDKLSRACFDCPAFAECNWQESSKNNNLRY